MDRRKVTTPMARTTEVSRGGPQKRALPVRSSKMHLQVKTHSLQMTWTGGKKAGVNISFD
jgi:hypothetical protein